MHIGDIMDNFTIVKFLISNDVSYEAYVKSFNYVVNEYFLQHDEKKEFYRSIHWAFDIKGIVYDFRRLSRADDNWFKIFLKYLGKNEPNLTTKIRDLLILGDLYLDSVFISQLTLDLKLTIKEIKKVLAQSLNESFLLILNTDLRQVIIWNLKAVYLQKESNFELTDFCKFRYVFKASDKIDAYNLLALIAISIKESVFEYNYIENRMFKKVGEESPFVNKGDYKEVVKKLNNIKKSINEPLNRYFFDISNPRKDGCELQFVGKGFKNANDRLYSVFSKKNIYSVTELFEE